MNALALAPRLGSDCAGLVYTWILRLRAIAVIQHHARCWLIGALPLPRSGLRIDRSLEGRVVRVRSCHRWKMAEIIQYYPPGKEQELDAFSDDEMDELGVGTPNLSPTPPNVLISFARSYGNEDSDYANSACMTLSLDTYSVRRDEPELAWHLVAWHLVR